MKEKYWTKFCSFSSSGKFHCSAHTRSARNLRYLHVVRKLGSVLLFVTCLSFVKGDLKPDYTLAVQANAIVTDNFSNVYTISADKFTKYDMKLKFQKEFSNKNFGNITSADVTNPLRTLLFYRDFGRIVFLDNTLSQNGDAIAMEQLGFPTATLAAASYDNGLWIYDQAGFELIRFNNNLEITARTGNLAQILGFEFQPNFLLEKDNRLFLNTVANGVLLFDVFGTYMKSEPIGFHHSFQVADNEIIYTSEGSLHSRNIVTGETTDYVQPVNDSAVNMRLERDAIFVQDSAHVYSFLRKK